VRRVARLTAVQNCILEQLARVQFATQKQLITWCGVNATSISTSVRGLIETGLIDGSLLSRPQLFHLTSAGARLVNVHMPAGGRHASWSVMAHACHLNSFEIEFAKHHPGFRMLSRLALLTKGLNPAHGEHAAVDGEKKTWFVLLDDYLMASDRITRSWERRHTPNLKYWPNHTGRTFSELTHHYIVVTTDPNQAERHNAWIEKHGISAEVLTIPAIWKN
jgi:hypothetical protein